MKEKRKYCIRLEVSFLIGDFFLKKGRILICQSLLAISDGKIQTQIYYLNKRL